MNCNIKSPNVQYWNNVENILDQYRFEAIFGDNITKDYNISSKQVSTLSIFPINPNINSLFVQYFVNTENN